MSAETLRRAAALMRERAEAATAGPWTCEGAPNGFPPLVTGVKRGIAIAETFDKPHLSDAAHIASWHPAVALAVADWLDVALAAFLADAKRAAEDYGGRFDLATYEDGWFDNNPALAVATAYLNEPDTT